MSASAPATKAAHPLRLLAVLCALMGFASISTDFYLPAMPAMAASLHARQAQMEWTISAYLVGFSLGQLVWGPIGDRYGRKRPIAAGLVLSRAMVRDLYGPDKAGQMLSTLITVMAVAPLVGPWLGGQVLLVAGWRAIFWLLVVIGVVTGLGLATVPETLPAERRQIVPWGDLAGQYGRLLRDATVLRCASIGAAYYLGVYAYVAGTSFAYITYHHVSPQHYGLLFGAGIIGIMGANMANVRLLPRFGGARVMRWGGWMACMSGVALALAASTDFGGLWGLVLPCFVFVSASGLIVANAMAQAMAGHPAQAGAVSALLGATQYGSGMVGAALIGLLADGTPRPMGWVIGLGGLACLVPVLVKARPRSIHEHGS
ncbi:multidrug effflux MFS transporter [Novosphingobium umbonatum]|uniref:multidrug effflux MFS transporter n=1 Tax=Novosphingobium umbonatum TaxID=1908524 RepID=UPI001FEC63A3|nr:multidrug effflux MFS transporter [Novosphingobium umbonatum]